MRENWRTVVLFLITLILAGLSFLLFYPFLAAIVWAIALKVATRTPFRWLLRKVKHPTLAAALALLLMILLVLIPTLILGQQLGQQLIHAASLVQSGEAQDWVLNTLRSYPHVEHYVDEVVNVVNLRQAAQSIGGFLASRLRFLLTASVSTVTQIVLMLFTLFFLFRDQDQAEELFRSLLPLNSKQADHLIERLSDSISATVQGSLTIAAIQGCLGGIMFKILGVPNALMWSVIMAIAATIPSLGTFLVWMPVSVYLALTGSWIKAIVLAAWGSSVIGSVDNLLYPTLVGSKLQLHTVPVLFAVLGGIGLFGITGIVLGPLTLTATVTLLKIWKGRVPSESGASEVDETKA